jgi:hypothetical protein
MIYLPSRVFQSSLTGTYSCHTKCALLDFEMVFGVAIDAQVLLQLVNILPSQTLRRESPNPGSFHKVSSENVALYEPLNGYYAVKTFRLRTHSPRHLIQSRSRAASSSAESAGAPDRSGSRADRRVACCVEIVDNTIERSASDGAERTRANSGDQVSYEDWCQ